MYHFGEKVTDVAAATNPKKDIASAHVKAAVKKYCSSATTAVQAA